MTAFTFVSLLFLNSLITISSHSLPTSKFKSFQPCLLKIFLLWKQFSYLLPLIFVLRKVYNIVDDDPAPREEVFAYARDLVEKKWPGQFKQSINESESFIKMGSPRGAKRVSNARMKKELGVRLLHPNYGSGLKSIINHM